MPDTSNVIAAQKVISFTKGKKRAIYTTTYGPEQSWNAYLACHLRHGANAAAKVENVQEVPRELIRSAWEELEDFSKNQKKSKGKDKEKQ